MRHRNHSKRLGRKPEQAKLLLKNLVTSILLYERVRTTKKRAQVARGLVDRVITIGKKEDTMNAIRRIAPYISDDNASRKILEVLKNRYAKRPSGFTRITPLGMRGGDGALLCEISLVDSVSTDAEPVMEKVQKTSTSKKKVSSSAS